MRENTRGKMRENMDENMGEKTSGVSISSPSNFRQVTYIILRPVL